jgi:SPP1 family predicted phage head-tail adaptor
MTIDAGKLDRRITAERASVTTDAFGGVVETWYELATVWAEKLDLSDGERWRTAEVAAQVTTRFRIRWRLAVTVEDRIVCDGRTFEVHGVKELGRREGQEITCAARTSDELEQPRGPGRAFRATGPSSRAEGARLRTA